MFCFVACYRVSIYFCSISRASLLSFPPKMVLSPCSPPTFFFAQLFWFKLCLSCRGAIPVMDRHSHCVWCLGEAHIPPKCTFCQQLKARSRTNQELKLKLLLIEGAFKPASDSGPESFPWQRSSPEPSISREGELRENLLTPLTSLQKEGCKPSN